MCCMTQGTFFKNCLIQTPIVIWLTSRIFDDTFFGETDEPPQYLCLLFIKLIIFHYSSFKFRDVEEIKQEQFPVENCTQIVDSREDCRNVAVPFTRVVEKIEYQTKWIQDCQTVNQPVCESSPCQVKK